MLYDQLPVYYTRLLPDELLQAPVQETRAQCSQCTKAQPGEAKPFRADLKCCTYHPFLPNYVAGEILEQPASVTPQSLQVVRDKILHRRYALPIGLVAPLSFQIPFHQRIPEDFGQREDWLCPYYDKTRRNCGIWRHRNSTCITYFCKSSYAQAGQEFWLALKSYLLFLEVEISAHCARVAGFSADEVTTQRRYLFRRDGSLYERHIPELPLEQSQFLWRNHYDTQEEFYLSCAKIAGELKASQLTPLFGAEEADKKRRCLEALNRINFSA